jgi:hypothetical protein
MRRVLAGEVGEWLNRKRKQTLEPIFGSHLEVATDAAPGPSGALERAAVTADGGAGLSPPAADVSWR